MKTVELHEFEEHAARYLAGGEALAIERDGQTVGSYVPATTKREAAREALRRLGETVERILAETGYTEDEPVSLFDLNVPESELPNPPRRARAGAGSVGATGH